MVVGCYLYLHDGIIVSKRECSPIDFDKNHYCKKVECYYTDSINYHFVAAANQDEQFVGYCQDANGDYFMGNKVKRISSVTDVDDCLSKCREIEGAKSCETDSTSGGLKCFAILAEAVSGDGTTDVSCVKLSGKGES